MNEMFDAAARLIELKTAAAEADERLKAIKAEAGKIEEAMAAQMLEDDLQNFTFSGHNFFLTARLHASVSADIMPDFIEALADRDLDGIVKTTVLPQTLTAFVKEQRENNDGETPAWMDPFVKVYTETKIGVRKYSK